MITAHGLRKRYGDKVAVDDLSFEVRPGVVTGFLGPNGAGKSTTMRLMLDLDHGAGETRFDGQRFRDIRDPMREIGAVLEAKAFHPTRTARNHLRMLAAANRIPKSRVDEVFDIVGLTEVKKKKPKGFSMGMAQRLGLAQALLGDPMMLILDEPANGLDPHGIHWLRDVLKSLAAQGRTVFVSSHLLAEMSLMADELVVIGRGKMIDSGSVDSFVRKFTQTTVLVRTPAADAFAETLRREGTDVEALPDGGLIVSGADASAVGELAHRDGVVLHELGILLSAAVALIIAIATRNADDAMSAVTVGNVLTGGGSFAIPFVPIFMTIIGIFATGHEYRHGTIQPTLMAIPQRSRLLIAKILVVAATAVVAVLLSLAVNLGIGLIFWEEMPTLGDDPLNQALPGYVVYTVLSALMGLALALLFRSLPAAIVVAFVMPLVVEGLITGLTNVPALDWLIPVVKFLPFTAGGLLLAMETPDFGPLTDEYDLFSRWAAGGIFAAFLAIILGAAWWLFQKRDA